MRRIIPMLFIITLIMAVGLMAHDEKEHAKPDSTPAVTHKQEQGRLPGLDDFPSLHPLVVHFPIVLLLIAPGLWLLGLWSKTRSHFYIAFTLGALGLLGAYMAGSWFHPHAHDRHQ